MAERILVHYRGNPEQLNWLFINEQHNISKIGHGSLAQLATLATGCKLSLLLSADMLYLDQVKLPAASRQKQIQAVPYALEDRLAEDVEDMHFTIGKKLPDDSLAVVAIRKDNLQQLLQNFREQKLAVDEVLPDLLALPWENNAWTLALDTSSGLIKNSEAGGLFCDPDNLSLYLDNLLESSPSMPEKLIVYRSDETPLTLSSEIPLEYRQLNQGLLPLLAQHLGTARSMNLLHGAFAIKRKSRIALQAWKAVPILAFIWIVLLLTQTVLQSRELAQQNEILIQQIETSFKRIFPTARKYTGIESRVKSYLKKLRSGSGKSQENFIELMSLSSPVLASNDKVKIQGLAYRDKHIDMELAADSLENLEKLKNQLTALPGIKITLSTSIEKKQINGKLRLEKQS